MSKREAVDAIRQLNPTAQPDFLAGFSEQELLEYLHQLQSLAREPRVTKDKTLMLAGHN